MWLLSCIPPSHLAGTPYSLNKHLWRNPRVDITFAKTVPIVSNLSHVAIPAICSLTLHYLSMWGRYSACVCWWLEQLGQRRRVGFFKVIYSTFPSLYFLCTLSYPTRINWAIFQQCQIAKSATTPFPSCGVIRSSFFSSRTAPADPQARPKRSPGLEDWSWLASCLVKMDERGGSMMEAAKGMPYPAAVKEAGQLVYCQLPLRKYSICAQSYVRHISHKSSWVGPLVDPCRLSEQGHH